MGMEKVNLHLVFLSGDWGDGGCLVELKSKDEGSVQLKHEFGFGEINFVMPVGLLAGKILEIQNSRKCTKHLLKSLICL